MRTWQKKKGKKGGRVFLAQSLTQRCSVECTQCRVRVYSTVHGVCTRFTKFSVYCVYVR